MLCMVSDLKSAFIAFMPRANGMPLGRTALQDFEISYFLNLAYSRLLKERVDAISAMYHQWGSGAVPASPRLDAPLSQLFSELGSLYRPIVPMDEWGGDTFSDYKEFLLWGPDAKMFRIYHYNGSLPYIISITLHEEEANLKDDDQVRRKSFPVRMLSSSEVLENSLLLRKDPSRLPYRFGRLIARYYNSPTEKFSDGIKSTWEFLSGYLGVRKDAYRNLVSRITGGFRVAALVEVMHKPTRADVKIRANVEFIAQPEPITEVEIQEDSKRLVEVGFGYEIAEAAAQIANAALGQGGQQTK